MTEFEVRRALSPDAEQAGLLSRLCDALQEDERRGSRWMVRSRPIAPEFPTEQVVFMMQPRMTPSARMPHLGPPVVRITEAVTGAGHYVLTRTNSLCGPQYELRVNGRYLMSTYSEESESELAHRALAMLGERPAARVLVGGLGVGYTLREVLTYEWVESATVIEIEPLVEAWARTHFLPFNGGVLGDPRTTVVIDDVGRYIRSTRERFDAILLDMDNGPHDAILEQNASLYDEPGLRRWAEHLTPGGVLAIWSTRRVEGFEERLHHIFPAAETNEVPTGAYVRTSAADYLFLARRGP